MSLSKTSLTTAGLCLVFLAGCGSSAPHPKLVEARTAYEEAKEGPAGDLAPARLEEARQALEKAEKAFDDDEESERAMTAAYVAIRRAHIATVRGNEKRHERQLEKLQEEYDELERKRLNMTTKELEEARRGLEKTKEELTREREARKAAESRLSAAVASLKEMANVKDEARGVVITLSGSVLFAVGKYRLLPIAKEKLNDVAAALKEQGYGKIIVEGHTDSQGSESANEELSLARAEAVRTHLISQGIDASKIVAKGLGESRPVASNESPEGRANNRRVEIIVEDE